MFDTKAAKMNNLAVCFLYLVLGIFLCVYPTLSIKLFCIILGSIAIVGGGYYVFQYLKSAKQGDGFKMSLIIGIVFIAIGLFVMFNSKIAVSILPVSVGIFFICDAILKGKIAFNIKQIGIEAWWIPLILAILETILGIVILFNPFATAAALVVMIGATFIFTSVIGFYTYLTYKI